MTALIVQCPICGENAVQLGQHNQDQAKVVCECVGYDGQASGPGFYIFGPSILPRVVSQHPHIYALGDFTQKNCVVCEHQAKVPVAVGYLWADGKYRTRPENLDDVQPLAVPKFLIRYTVLEKLDELDVQAHPNWSATHIYDGEEVLTAYDENLDGEEKQIGVGVMSSQLDAQFATALRNNYAKLREAIRRADELTYRIDECDTALIKYQTARRELGKDF